MESKLSKWPAQKEQDSHTVMMVLCAMFLAVVEMYFILPLVRLIRGHASLRYVFPAVLFQLALVMAAITYRRIWRILRSTGSSAVDAEKLLGEIGYMVMCLLFALMFHSDFAAEAAKVIQ